MNDLEEFLRETENENLREARIKEQRDKNDFSYLEDGSFELCDSCKSQINSHGHCPRCDY